MAAYHIIFSFTTAISPWIVFIKREQPPFAIKSNNGELVVYFDLIGIRTAILRHHVKKRILLLLQVLPLPLDLFETVRAHFVPVVVAGHKINRSSFCPHR